MEEDSEILLRNVLRSLSMLKERLATPEVAVEAIFWEYNKDHIAQPPRESESLIIEVGPGAGLLAGDGIAKGVASWVAIRRE